MAGRGDSASVLKHQATRDWSKTTVGERVEHLCELRGIGQNELGNVAGLKSGHMSKLANNKNIIARTTSATLRKIADAMNVELEWLTFGRGPIEAPPAAGTPALRRSPMWLLEFPKAIAVEPLIPAYVWEKTGNAMVDVPPDAVDWQLIQGVAREIYAVHQRKLVRAAEADEPVPPSAVSSDADEAPPSRSGEVSVSPRSRRKSGAG